MAEIDDTNVSNEEKQTSKKESLEEILARIDNIYKGYRVNEDNTNGSGDGASSASTKKAKPARVLPKNNLSDFDFARELSAIKAELSGLAAIRLDLKGLNAIQSALAELPLIKSELEGLSIIKSDYRSIDEIRNQLRELSAIRDEVQQLKEFKDECDFITELKTAAQSIPYLKSEIANLKSSVAAAHQDSPTSREMEEIKLILLELPAIKSEIEYLKNNVAGIKIEPPDLSGLDDIKAILAELPEIKQSISSLKEDLSKFQEMDANIKALSGIQAKLVDVLDEIKTNLGNVNALNEQVAGLATKADLCAFGEIRTPADHLLEAIGAKLVEVDNKSNFIDAKIAELSNKLDNNFKSVSSSKMDDAVAGGVLEIFYKKFAEINANFENAISAVSDKVDTLGSMIQNIDVKPTETATQTEFNPEVITDMESKLNAVDENFVAIGSKLASIDEKLAEVDSSNKSNADTEARLEAVDEKIDAFDSKMIEVINKLQFIEEKVTKDQQDEKEEIRTVWGDSKDKIPVVDLPEFPEDKDPIALAEEAEIIIEPTNVAVEDLNLTRKRKAITPEELQSFEQ